MPLLANADIGCLGDVLQKDLRTRAALSDSGPRDVGQNASEPILFVSLFTGAPSFSNAAQPLSKVALLPCLVFSQADFLVWSGLDILWLSCLDILKSVV
jgi:hypothetical protein